MLLTWPAWAQGSREEIVSAGGYRLNIRIQPGNRPDLPVILLESGGGWDSSQWEKLQPELAAQTGATVVSYDRPGYGKSPLPERPYDIVAETKAFHTALE